MLTEEQAKELTHLTPIAISHGVDPCFVMAIRIAENGGPGKEFGVLSVHAPTYDEQCAVCCATVAHRLFTLSTAAGHIFPIDFSHGCAFYSDEFIQHFANIWAPRGATNDPNGLNSNWAHNVIQLYKEIRGHAAASI